MSLVFMVFEHEYMDIPSPQLHALIESRQGFVPYFPFLLAKMFRTDHITCLTYDTFSHISLLPYNLSCGILSKKCSYASTIFLITLGYLARAGKLHGSIATAYFR